MELRLSASTPLASNTASTSLAWRSSRLACSSTRPHAASSRQAASTSTVLPTPPARFLVTVMVSPPVSGSRLLAEQLLHAIGSPVGDIGSPLRLEQELVGLDGHFEHLAGHEFAVGAADLICQPLHVGGV